MELEVATLTAKGQVTVPKAVREALGLQRGDQLSWEVEDGSVRVGGPAPCDPPHFQFCLTDCYSQRQPWAPLGARPPASACRS